MSHAPAFTTPPHAPRPRAISLHSFPSATSPARLSSPRMTASPNQKPTLAARFAKWGRVAGISAAAIVAANGIVNVAHKRLSTADGLLGNGGGEMVQRVMAAAKFSKKSVSEKLSQVPVFAVTNASGQPYLANMDGSGSQIGLIFFSHHDAIKMLKDMKKNPGAADARVYIMGLDKAYEMVKAKPTPSGIRGSGGEELTMVFRFFPDSKQVKAAEGLQRKLRIRSGVEGVPVFVAKGLTLRKGNESVVPLFLTKEDLDAAWSKLRESNKELPNSASVVVGNLLYIIQQMENEEQPELRNLGFFAPRASVEYVTKEQAGPTGQARLHQNPVQQAQQQAQQKPAMAN